MSRPVSPLLPSNGTPNPGPPKFRPRVVSNKLSMQPSVRALFVFLSAFIFALLYGHRHFYRDPGSIFFDPEHAYTRWYSAHRENEAKEYIQAASFMSEGREDFNDDDFSKAFRNASICAAIPTVNRDISTHYVETTIASMLQGLSEDERADLNLQIFFATTHPKDHSSFSKPWVRDVTDRIYSYEDIVPEAALKKLASLEAEHELFEKSVYDYTLALQQCFENTTAPFIAVFEDDVLVAEGWLPRIRVAMKELLHKMRKDKSRFDDSWLYLRLFNQERSTGWGSTKIGGNHELLICLIFGAVVFVVLRTAKARSPAVRSHIDNGAIGVICLLAIPSFVVLFFQAGKASLLPPRPGVREEDFGCCSQGLLFNRQHIPALVDYLRSNGAGQYDMMTMAFAREKGLAMFSLYPMIVQHIGLTSAKGTLDVESRQIWSMAFENYDPQKIHNDHMRLASEVYAKDPMEPVIFPGKCSEATLQIGALGLSLIKDGTDIAEIDFSYYHYPGERNREGDD